MQLKKTAHGQIAFCADTPAEISPEWFTEAFWRRQNCVIGSSSGRNITWFVEHNHQRWALRHYWRGGLIAKLIKDAYPFAGYENTRAFAELQLLEQLYAEDFAVPKPVAAHVVRSGFVYRADILTTLLPQAQDLVGLLAERALTGDEWQNLGQLIAKFHQRGVYHADLNAKNILLSEGQFYLIDFDRGELRDAAPDWQRSNIERLLRSFRKEKTKQPALAFDDTCWQQLMVGYQQINPLALRD
ncbi:3-deoxy-D-manno-octulosonic acid kinase [Shewanella sp. C32]|uniref:3-deoxy-D-manno-octulosonic acid kinase n=1 Tax=Shewanella electrica TaxID=515560 RepID=A0ABT2FMI1_9GAMM|nr:3-deoxy-D-manno-octulosonic acid kinase [Shewanella electrica]MCH1925889.1 3-deoxy-D-manno-octulosonic acid kinase [Shewanella electrica]MCS4557226.1 3-deoxy-D-manno-octulosonic acid kinase [Shewanella electrica]